MTTKHKINIHEYFSEYGMASEIASLSPLRATQIRSSLYRLKRGENIIPRTKRLLYEAINKREGGTIQLEDITWIKQ